MADAQPYLEGYGQLLGRDGKPIGGNGPPTQAANWVSDPALNPYRFVAGHAPRADDEVVINRGAAKTGHLALGATTTLLTPQPVRVHIVGITTFGTADGFGPGTFTGMTLHAARQHLARSQGPDPAELSQILVRASPGVPDTELAARLRPALPSGVQAITGSQLATENLNDINSGFLGFLSTGLTAFAAVALLVAAFSIYNTFSILAAQRGRESALLRALGGTRRQLAVAGLAETLVVGLVGSVAGWAGGIGIAALLKGVFDGFGFALPAGGLVLRASSSVLAVAVGVAATVLAGVLPTLRASRVPVVYPDGTRARLRVAAIFDHPDITGDYLFAAAGWAPHAGQPLDSMVLIKLKPGAGLGPARAAVTAATAAAGQPRVQDRAQYVASATGGVNTILGLVYVMLALAILIALMGVANTLSLSIHERTRELGLLRALGQTRAQARGMIRWESVIIAVFGTLGGVILGTFLGWAVVRSSGSAALGVFAAPPLQLVLFLVLGALTGILAGIRPARRAARLNMITAIASV